MEIFKNKNTVAGHARKRQNPRSVLVKNPIGEIPLERSRTTRRIVKKDAEAKRPNRKKYRIYPNNNAEFLCFVTVKLSELCTEVEIVASEFLAERPTQLILKRF